MHLTTTSLMHILFYRIEIYNQGQCSGTFTLGFLVGYNYVAFSSVLPWWSPLWFTGALLRPLLALSSALHRNSPPRCAGALLRPSSAFSAVLRVRSAGIGKLGKRQDSRNLYPHCLHLVYNFTNIISWQQNRAHSRTCPVSTPAAATNALYTYISSQKKSKKIIEFSSGDSHMVTTHGEAGCRQGVLTGVLFCPNSEVPQIANIRYWGAPLANIR